MKKEDLEELLNDPDYFEGECSNCGVWITNLEAVDCGYECPSCGEEL